MPVILKSISLPRLRLVSDLVPLAFSPKNQNLFHHMILITPFSWRYSKHIFECS